LPGSANDAVSLDKLSRIVDPDSTALRIRIQGARKRKWRKDLIFI
jgi:hypothetical protein